MLHTVRQTFDMSVVENALSKSSLLATCPFETFANTV